MPIIHSTETLNFPYFFNNNKTAPANNSGAKVSVITALVNITATDSANSTWKIARVPSAISIHRIHIDCTAITGGTDFSLGLYSVSNAVNVEPDPISATLFASSLNFATAQRNINGLTNISVANVGKYLWELTGESLIENPNKLYDIVLKANTIGTTAGSVSFKIEYKI